MSDETNENQPPLSPNQSAREPNQRQNFRKPWRHKNQRFNQNRGFRHRTHRFRQHTLKQGVYLVPSSLTAGAMFSGFYAIIFTLNNVFNQEKDFRPAVMAIIIAAFLDSLDGRMARLMKAETEFGFQFDSLADIVSFGVAPSIFVYALSLHALGRLGWLAAFLYMVCAGIRLARFNVLASEAPSKKYFKGLASPIAAGGLVCFCYWMKEWVPEDIFGWMVFGMTIFIALLMISNVRFRSFKDLDFRRNRFQIFFVLVFTLAMIFTLQEIAIFGFFVIYLITGLVEELILFQRRRRSDPKTRFVPFGD